MKALKLGEKVIMRQLVVFLDSKYTLKNKIHYILLKKIEYKKTFHDF